MAKTGYLKGRKTPKMGKYFTEIAFLNGNVFLGVFCHYRRLFCAKNMPILMLENRYNWTIKCLGQIESGNK